MSSRPQSPVDGPLPGLSPRHCTIRRVLLGVLILSSVCTAAAVGWYALEVVGEMRAVQRVQQSARLEQTAVNAALLVALERGTTTLLLEDARTRRRVESLRADVDRRHRTLLALLDAPALSTTPAASCREELQRAWRALDEARRRVDSGAIVDATAWEPVPTRYVAAAAQCRTLVELLPARRGFVHRLGLRLRALIADVAERAGRERALLARVLAEDRALTPAERTALARDRTLNRADLRSLHHGLARLPATPALVEIRRRLATDYEGDYAALNARVLAAVAQGPPYEVDAHSWFTAATDAIEVLAATAETVSTFVGRDLDALADDSRKRVAAVVVIAAGLVLTLTAGAFLIHYRLLGPLRRLDERVRLRAAGEDTPPAALGDDELGRLGRCYEALWQSHSVEATRRNAMALAADRAQQYLETLFDSVIDAVLVVNSQRVIVDCNRAVETVFGYRRDELIGRSTACLYADREAFEAAPGDSLARIRAEGHAVGQNLLRRRDGSVFPGCWSASHLVLPGCAETGIVAVVRDISELKESEVALRHSREQLRLVTDALPVLVSYVDAEHRYRFNNHAYRDWFGLEADQIQDRPVRDVLGAEAYARVRPYLERALAGEEVHYERSLPYRHGGERFVEASYLPHRDERGRVHGVVVLVQDITERKQNEEARLARAREQRDLLVREVHHRIKNNLHGVIGLLRRHAQNRPETAPALDEAIAQIHSLATVHGLQSRGEQPRVTLAGLVRDIVSMVAGMHGGEPPPRLDLDDCAAVAVRSGEAVPVALIINELVSNAFKHGATAGAVIDVTLRCAPARAVLTIDNPAEALPPGFDFAGGRGLGTGLELVRLLLPGAGTALSYDLADGRLRATLTLTPPVLRGAEDEAED